MSAPGRSLVHADALHLVADEHAARAREGDRWLRVCELAELLDVTADYVYAHWRELGGLKLGASRNAPIRFRLEDVVTACSARRESEGAEGSRDAVRPPRRRRGFGTSGDLLPIGGRRS